MKTIFTLFLLFIGFFSSAQVKIYEIYGGGGTTSATYDSDYVVLVNTGSTSVNLANWSVQYAARTSTSWQKATISSGTIPGNFGFFLIKLNNNPPTGAVLPAPDIDVSATSSININAISGKIALLNNNTTIPAIANPQAQTGIQDFIGYGGTSASNAPDASEGNNPATTGSSTAALRKNQDTDNNGNDYKRVTPTPLNSNSPLPVTLTSFKASTLGQEVILDWKTTDESNFSHFSVERSYDAKSFEAIGRIDAKAKSTSDETAYQFVDQTPNFGLNYYRLKKVDIDGSSDYSRIITANMTETSPIVIYPNPSADFIRIKNGEKEAIKSYEIYNISGRLIRQNESTATEIKIQDLPSGVYFLQLKNERNVLTNRRFIKI